MSIKKVILLLCAGTALVGAAALTMFGGASPAQQSRLQTTSVQDLTVLQITSPPDGAVVTPGQTITVSVSASLGTAINGGVVILGEVPLPASELKTSPPFQFSLTIPAATPPGRYHVTAIGGHKPNLLKSQSITLDVEKAEPLTDLRVEPTLIKFPFAGQQIPLRVVGSFADGTIFDLTNSSRTTYGSNDAMVATVDGAGLVTAVGPGSTTVTVRYGTKSMTVPVSVPSTIQGDLNGDGRVDQDDLDIILAALNTPAVGAFDARDLNHDGIISMADAKLLVALCTSRCNTINIPPDVSSASSSIESLWPPDHRMVPVSILGVTDPDGDLFTIKIDAIRQDEPTSGVGDGDTCPDGAGVGSATAQLRAERSGTGVGRVYTIFFTAEDSRAGKSRGTVQVCVPHDQGGMCEFTGFHSKPAVDSTVCNP